jgi:diguanylate cyclase (GGDEF)-like protein
MHVDLLTLYFLAIGTLLASSAMTLWERRTHPSRRKELNILSGAYATLAVGCAAAAFRHTLPGSLGSALSNLVIVTGYLLILHGAATLNRRQYRVGSLVILVLLALTWAIAGASREGLMWGYVSAIPIAIACGMSARELLRDNALKRFQSRRIAAWVSAVHAIFYAFRAFVLPWLATRYGTEFFSIASKVTMYEGVLYSVVLPMTLLKLVREESHEKLRLETQTDYLTGLGNRRRFFEEGTRVIRDSGATRPMSLLAFDLDHFKAINDRYGHETGDEVLKSFGKIARDVMGPDAILARIGGEEFAALLPGHDRRRAQEVGDAVVQRFASTVSHRSNGVAIQATVSGGLAHAANDEVKLAELLAAADQALYRAKSLGGNRLELAQNATQTQSANDDTASRRKTTA